MNVDYVRQVAGECDRLVLRAEYSSIVTTALARAAAVLHTAVLPPESHGERPNGSGSVQGDTEEAPEGQSGTDQVAPNVNQLGTGIRIDLAADVDDEKLAKAVGEQLRRIRLAEHAIPTAMIPAVGDAERLERAEHDRDSYRKRWHEAATQRDALFRAAQEYLDDDSAKTRPELLEDLDKVVRAVELKDPPSLLVVASADRLRRELWHVLDRMPASDDDLIATVKKLKGSVDV